MKFNKPFTKLNSTYIFLHPSQGGRSSIPSMS
jgi:hypothetical protein